MERFPVSSDGFEFSLVLLPMEDLHIHEGTIPELVESLSHEIETMNVLRNPIIVEDRHCVVLDGTHRVQALRSLGCTRVAACTLDYFSDRVSVGRWFRTFQSDEFNVTVMKVLKRLGSDFSERDVSEVLDGLSRREVACGFLWENKGLLVFDGGGLAGKLEIVKRFERGLQELGCEFGYEVEGEAVDKLSMGLVSGILALPPIEKRDVIDCASKGYIFPRKTTRHVVPARPWNVSVPLPILRRRDMSLEEANRIFIGLLKDKRIRVVPPGSLLEGRRYEEEVYEFVGR